MNNFKYTQFSNTENDKQLDTMSFMVYPNSLTTMELDVNCKCGVKDIRVGSLQVGTNIEDVFTRTVDRKEKERIRKMVKGQTRKDKDKDKDGNEILKITPPLIEKMTINGETPNYFVNDGSEMVLGIFTTGINKGLSVLTYRVKSTWETMFSTVDLRIAKESKKETTKNKQSSGEYYNTTFYFNNKSKIDADTACKRSNLNDLSDQFVLNAVIELSMKHGIELNRLANVLNSHLGLDSVLTEDTTPTVDVNELDNLLASSAPEASNDPEVEEVEEEVSQAPVVAGGSPEAVEEVSQAVEADFSQLPEVKDVDVEEVKEVDVEAVEPPNVIISNNWDVVNFINDYRDELIERHSFNVAPKDINNVFSSFRQHVGNDRVFVELLKNVGFDFENLKDNINALVTEFKNAA